MSESVPAHAKTVFCDTSVLLDYVLGQGNEGARKLLTESDCLIVISEKVDEEFERVPERREDIYLDFMKVIPSDDGSVEDLSISDRPYLKPNDEGFFEALQDEIAKEETVEERLTRLREKLKIVDRRYGQTREIVHRICEQNHDFSLLLGLNGVVDNEDDCQVVSDAIQWSDGGGSGRFATLDVDDIIDAATEINEVVVEHHDDGATLDIGRPRLFLED